MLAILQLLEVSNETIFEMHRLTGKNIHNVLALPSYMFTHLIIAIQKYTQPVFIHRYLDL